MSDTLTANIAERIDNKTLQHVREEVAHSEHALPESTASLPQGRLARFLEVNVAKTLGQRQLNKLLEHRGRIAVAWREVPNRMHQVANQTKLMMELLDDFRTGAYRKVPWRSLAVCTAAILYVTSPADLIPDFVAGLGVLDDLAVTALAARVIREDLRAYCEWKSYPVNEYFAA